MVNKMIEWFARNTVAANLLMIGIVLAGSLFFLSMQREVFPSFALNGVQIEVGWPGASPKDVEEQIVTRIEESVSDIDNIEWIKSFANEGQASVSIRTTENVDMTQFIADVKNRVDSISSFPSDIETIRVFQWVQRKNFLRVAIVGDIGEKQMRRLGEELRREAAKLDAISLVELFGARDEEVSIEVSEDSLKRYGLSIQDVASAVQGSSLNLSSGTVRTEAGDFRLGIRNLADNEADFGDIVVRQTPEGGKIRVSDVATVIDGFVDDPVVAKMNGEPAVLLEVKTTDVMYITKASEAVQAWIEDRSRTLPAGVDMFLWTDDAKAFNSRMTTIGNAAFQGLLLVLVVLILTLRPIVAVWVAIGIATAYAGTFIFLDGVGVSLNMLSTFAFLLVLGIVVDDAIVVGESIHSESHKTGGGITSAVLGAQLVAKPVIFAVLTTIIAFLPWLFLSGAASNLTKNITWVVILALTFSLIESLLILPAHLSAIKPRTSLNALDKLQKPIANGIVTFANTTYRRAITAAVDHRWLTTSVFTGILIFTFVGIWIPGYVKQAFDPEIESDQVSIEVVMPDGTQYVRSEQVLLQLETAQRALIAEAEAETGKADTLVDTWYTRAQRDNILAIVNLAGPESRTKPTKDVALRLAELIGDIPDAEDMTVSYTMDDKENGVEFLIWHKDLDLLRLAVEDLENQLRTYGAVYNVRNDLQDANDEIQFRLKPGAEQLGLTLAGVSEQVRQAYFGLEVQRLPRDGQDVRVYVRYPKSERESIESLEHFRIRTADGREVPLLAVADIDFAPGISRIVRRDQQRTATIKANLKESVRGEISADLDKSFWDAWQERHPGAGHGATGQAESEAKFFEDIKRLYIVAFFCMYMMLAIAFKSYAQPILFLIAIPYAVVGAILGHLLLGEVMAVMSYFGVAAAAGVVINDNLVLVDYCNRLRTQGMSAYKAIIEAGVNRFRPIMLTTVTTIVGLIPMMLEQSTQAGYLQPIVIALCFGVGIAFFVTLFLVPALYVCGDDLVTLTDGAKAKVRGWFTSPDTEKQTRPAE